MPAGRWHESLHLVSLQSFFQSVTLCPCSHFFSWARQGENCWIGLGPSGVKIGELIRKAPSKSATSASEDSPAVFTSAISRTTRHRSKTSYLLIFEFLRHSHVFTWRSWRQITLSLLDRTCGQLAQAFILETISAASFESPTWLVSRTLNPNLRLTKQIFKLTFSHMSYSACVDRQQLHVMCYI